MGFKGRPKRANSKRAIATTRAARASESAPPSIYTLSRRLDALGYSVQSLSRSEVSVADLAAVIHDIGGAQFSQDFPLDILRWERIRDERNGVQVLRRRGVTEEQWAAGWWFAGTRYELFGKPAVGDPPFFRQRLPDDRAPRVVRDDLGEEVVDPDAREEILGRRRRALLGEYGEAFARLMRLGGDVSRAVYTVCVEWHPVQSPADLSRLRAGLNEVIAVNDEFRRARQRVRK